LRRVSAARSASALVTVERLTLAISATALTVAPGFACSAARVRSRASVDLGARRLCFRRGAPRDRGRPARLRGSLHGPRSAPGPPEILGSGAITAPRTAAVVSGPKVQSRETSDDFSEVGGRKHGARSPAVGGEIRTIIPHVAPRKVL
jgi:hypothetical protein